MDDFAAFYGRYSEECLRRGIRPLAPEEVAALLEALRTDNEALPAPLPRSSVH